MSLIKHKRTFTTGYDPNVAIPATVDDIGTLFLNTNSNDRKLYIGTADADGVSNPAWNEIDTGAATGVNVNANIPVGTGTTVEDDINEFLYGTQTGGSYAGPLDSTAVEEALIEAGTNLYFQTARDGATYLYGGPIPVAIGNESPPGTPGAPAPTDAPHRTVLNSDLIAFGGNPDAIVGNPTPGLSQVINAAAVGDTPLRFNGFTGQTAPLTEYAVNGSVQSRITATGRMETGDSAFTPGTGYTYIDPTGIMDVSQSLNALDFTQVVAGPAANPFAVNSTRPETLIGAQVLTGGNVPDGAINTLLRSNKATNTGTVLSVQQDGGSGNAIEISPDVGATVTAAFNANGHYSTFQGAVGTGSLISLEGFGGNPNAILDIQNRTADVMFQVFANADVLGDGVQRSRVAFGEAGTEGVVEHAVIDGGVF